MTISATTRTTALSTDHASVRDSRADYDHAQDFAGMLAGAVKSPAAKPEPRKPAEGTSELDRPEHTDDTSDARDARDAREATNTRAAQNARDARDAAAARDTKAARDAKDTRRADEARDARHAKHSKHVRTHTAASDATSAGQTDPATSDVIKSTSALDPELQAKLARVMTRMQSETGHDVTVAETVRSQDRQNVLFAQGRETPGQVVTWTRNSKHTQGRAVDLVLDGGAAGFDAYATLQRIAQEEGLRTLGARDPGHLELPGTGAAVNTAATNAGKAADVTPIPAAPADASGPGQVSIARLAQVAQVAQVSQVSVERPAEVARVATVARAGNGTAAAAQPTDGQPSAVVNTHAPNALGETAKEASRRFSGDASDREGSKGEQRGGYGALAAAVALRDASASAGGVTNVAAGHASTAADRVAQVIAAYEDAPARPLSQITMSVDAGNGGSDRIQLAMRGSTLSATIDSSDVQRANSMHSRSDELVRALGRDGIEVESLRVRATAANTVATATPSQNPSDSQTGSRFERQSAWQQQDRQRSQDDRRQQQRNQRGGQDK